MTRLLTTFLMLMLLAGCSEKKKEPAGGSAQPAANQPFVPSGSDEEQVRQMVRRYNALLADGYRTLNMNPVAEVATQDQAEKAYTHMAAIGEGEVRMLSSLKKIDFTGINRQQPDTFVAKTKEVWDFTYTDIKTGKEAGRETNFLYEVTYFLKKDGSRWVIHDIVAYAPNDREQPQPPRVIKPPEGGTAPALSPEKRKGAP
jgi:hypothetical protein